MTFYAKSIFYYYNIYFIIMSLNDFLFIQKLGEGEYSSVFKVIRKFDNKQYALKKIKISQLTQKQRQNALNEVRILASFHHNNIVGFKEVFFNDEANLLCLVMQYCDDGDLYHKIAYNIKEKLRFSEPFIWKVIICIARALQKLHKYKILHRDLKSANIYLNKSGVAKLGDMNLSKITQNGVSYSQIGTPYYASPQVWNQQPYDQKSDIWSFGCIIHEMCTLRPPFRGKTIEQLYNAITKGEYSKISKRYSQDLGILIQLMLNTQALLRPSCNDILKLSCIKQKLKLFNNSEYSQTTQRILPLIPYSSNIQLLKTILPPSNYTESSKNSQKQLKNQQTHTDNYFIKQNERKLDKETQKDFSIFNKEIYNFTKPFTEKEIGVGTNTGQEKQIQTDFQDSKKKPNTQTQMYRIKFDTFNNQLEEDDIRNSTKELPLKKLKKLNLKKNRIQTEPTKNIESMNLKQIQQEKQRQKLLLQNKNKEKQLEIQKSKSKIKQLEKRIQMQLQKQEEIQKLRNKQKLRQLQVQKLRKQLKVTERQKEKQLHSLILKQNRKQSVIPDISKNKNLAQQKIKLQKLQNNYNTLQNSSIQQIIQNSPSGEKKLIQKNSIKKSPTKKDVKLKKQKQKNDKSIIPQKIEKQSKKNKLNNSLIQNSLNNENQLNNKSQQYNESLNKDNITQNKSPRLSNQQKKKNKDKKKNDMINNLSNNDEIQNRSKNIKGNDKNMNQKFRLIKSASQNDESKFKKNNLSQQKQTSLKKQRKKDLELQKQLYRSKQLQKQKEQLLKLENKNLEKVKQREIDRIQKMKQISMQRENAQKIKIQIIQKNRNMKVSTQKQKFKQRNQIEVIIQKNMKLQEDKRKELQKQKRFIQLEKQRRRIIQERQSLKQIQVQKKQQLIRIQKQLKLRSYSRPQYQTQQINQRIDDKKTKVDFHNQSFTEMKTQRKKFKKSKSKSKKKMKTETKSIEKDQQRTEINLNELIQLRKNKIKTIIEESKLIHDALREKDRINDYHLMKKLNFPIIVNSQPITERN